MKRREFLRTTALGIAGTSLVTVFNSHVFAQDSFPDVVWVENGQPKNLLQTAFKEIGGIHRFISKGDIVVVKPNMSWDKSPEYAATTNPELLSELVKMCLNAGAKEVKVFDRTCNNPQRCYKNTQLEEVASAAGANVTQIRKNRFKDKAIPNGEMIKEWPIYEDYLEADKVINLPIAKHHSLSRVTLGMKNLMGVMGGQRGSIHSGFSKKIVDIGSELMPTLTIIDAYRILTRSGPQGGSLDDVKLTKTLIMSPCMVTADCTALNLFDLNLEQVGHLDEAVRRGLNKYDLNNLQIRKLSLS